MVKEVTAYVRYDSLQSFFKDTVEALQQRTLIMVRGCL